MKNLMIVALLTWQTSVFSQGTFVYRNGADVMSGTLIDLNLDGTTDFRFGHPLVSIGNGVIRQNRLTPLSNPNLPSTFAGESMLNSSSPREIEWLPGQSILPDPSPGGEWRDLPLNMQYMLVAIRLRNGEDWNYGWMRFEKIGEDAIGDFWGLRDAAYNSIPNAPINMLQVREPSTFVLMLSGAVVVAFSKWRSRSNQ